MTDAGGGGKVAGVTFTGIFAGGGDAQDDAASASSSNVKLFLTVSILNLLGVPLVDLGELGRLAALGQPGPFLKLQDLAIGLGQFLALPGLPGSPLSVAAGLGAMPLPGQPGRDHGRQAPRQQPGVHMSLEAGGIALPTPCMHMACSAWRRRTRPGRVTPLALT